MLRVRWVSFDRFKWVIFSRRYWVIFTVFSMLSILISLVGVFGLITFETQYRTQEIGLRKINGATTPEILGMFNRYFLWINAVGCCIAVPLAYYSVRHWLEGFAYRTPVHGWVFAAVCLGIIGFTLLTVTIRCWRTAHANPIHSIKTE